MTTTLPDHCLMVPGCRAPRYRYHAGCAAHAPGPPPPPPRCAAPLRCYCIRHLGAQRAMLGPHDSPESIRARLAALDERRRATVRLAPPVT